MLAPQIDGLTPKRHRRHYFTTPSDVHPDLSDMIFRKVLESARDSTTISDNGYLAPTGPGTLMYHFAIAKIRELMAEKNWKPDSVRNLPYAISPDGSVKITTATGDASTGIKGRQGPQLKGKGIMSSVLNGQLALFDADDYLADQQQGKLWYLVFYVDKRQQEIRMELSRPNFNADNQVKGWINRIIMSPVPLQNNQISLPPVEDIPSINISPIDQDNTGIAVGY